MSGAHSRPVGSSIGVPAPPVIRVTRYDQVWSTLVALVAVLLAAVWFLYLVWGSFHPPDRQARSNCRTHSRRDERRRREWLAHRLAQARGDRPRAGRRHAGTNRRRTNGPRSKKCSKDVSLESAQATRPAPSPRDRPTKCNSTWLPSPLSKGANRSERGRGRPWAGVRVREAAGRGSSGGTCSSLNRDPSISMRKQLDLLRHRTGGTFRRSHDGIHLASWAARNPSCGGRRQEKVKNVCSSPGKGESDARLTSNCLPSPVSPSGPTRSFFISIRPRRRICWQSKSVTIATGLSAKFGGRFFRWFLRTTATISKSPARSTIERIAGKRDRSSILHR